MTYRYEFGGQQLVGNTVRSGLVSYNWRGPAERICERYAVNSKIRVYVDPRQPSRAVLEPGRDRKFLALMGAVGAVFLLVGLLLFVS